ncbi:hypothetical protein EON83_21040 [bacterium]|nr:MAG: hypothetical protein EON83_21040 [bacterium]
MKIWLLPLALMAGTSSASLAVAAPRPAPRSPHTPRLLNMSRQVATYLKQNNMQGVSRYVDSRWGLRFSGEVFVNDGDVKLSRTQVARLRTDKTIRNWGTYYGDDGPIKLNWTDYRKRYVWPRDFTMDKRASVNGTVRGHSTVINNMREFYPKATFVEFYLPPSSHDGMDWASLWMVWRQNGATWRLIGIAYNQWST